MSPTQGLQSAGSGGESEPETEADGRSVGAGGRGAEAGTAHPEMQPGYETHERLCEQPEISFFCLQPTLHPEDSNDSRLPLDLWTPVYVNKTTLMLAMVF